MPKYYCDYCDIFLTHDSPSVRKSHNEGWKHKAAVRAYYSQFEQDATQNMIEQKVREWQEGSKMGTATPEHKPQKKTKQNKTKKKKTKTKQKT